MIVFNCPTCGKNYHFSDRFVGRTLICTICKTHLVVPENQEKKNKTSENSSIFFSVPLPPPLPDSLATHHSVSSSVPLPPPPPETGTAIQLDETTEILAHVYQEKHQDAIHQPEKEYHDNASTSFEELVKPKLKRWKNIRFWTSILFVLILIFGVSIYFVRYADFGGPDTRPEILRQLERHASESLLNAGQKNSDVETFRLRSLDDWNKGCEVSDVFILTQNERDRKKNDLLEIQKALDRIGFSDKQKTEILEKQKEISESIVASNNRLIRLSEQSNEYMQNAIKNEAITDLSAQDAFFFQKESEFYTEQSLRLQWEISEFPKSRKSFTMQEFALERKRLLVEKPFRLDNDWTENRFDTFDLSNNDRTFPAVFFEGNRRLHGDKSFRFCFFDKTPIKIIFPKNRMANSSLPQACFLSLGIRFPELQSLLLGEGDPDSGKLAEIKIRFVNTAGYIEYKTSSSEYLETIFYDARGKFTLLEFSLEGDAYWIRNDHVDLNRLKEERADNPFIELDKAETEKPSQENIQENKSEPSFFEKIDWVELQIVPMTNRTLCWIDDIFLTEKQNKPPFDMEQQKNAQRELRDWDRSWHARLLEENSKTIRDWLASLSVDNTGNVTVQATISRGQEHSIATDIPAMAEEEKSSEEKELEFEGAKEERIRKLFRLVLQEAKGKIRGKQFGRVLTFGSKSAIPDNLEDIQIEEISLSTFRRLNEEFLDLIGEQTKLRSLNLARTNLDDRMVIKLASLVSLEVLDLSGNQLTFEAFNSIRSLKKLRELNVSGIQSGVEGLDALGGLTELRKLVLSRSGINGVDLNYLLPLADLEELDISSTKIGDRGLSTVKTFTKLQTLNLSKTRITNAGLQILKNLRQLKRLNLDGNNLDNSCLSMMKGLPVLEQVSALGTKITNDGVHLELGPDWMNRFQLSDASIP